MGEKATGDNGFNIEEVRPGGNGNGTESKSTSDSRTGGRTGGDRAGERTGGSTGGKTEEKELSRLAILTEEEKALYAAGDDTEKKRIMRNAKKRERYRQQKQAGGQTVKPRKVRGKQKEPENVLDVTQLNLIIAGVSSAIASRPNCEHWLLTEGEINSITTPLSKMLAESAMFSNMGQYSNQIALVMACITVFAPRLMITAQKQKEVKKRARTGQQTDTNVRDIGEKKTGNSKSDRRNDNESSTNGKNNDNTVPFYGVPIC